MAAHQPSDAVALYRKELTRVAEQAGQIRDSTKRWRDERTPPLDEVVEHAERLAVSLGIGSRGTTTCSSSPSARAMCPAQLPWRSPTRGDPTLVSEAHDALDGFDVDSDVAIPVDLVADPIVGVCGGSAEDRRRLARAMLVQLAVRDSPNDVRFAVLGADWAWARWFPHSGLPNLDGPSVAADSERAAAVVDGLRDIVERRSSTPSSTGPRVVAVVEAPVAVPAVTVNAVVARAAEAQISIVWLTDERAGLPSGCQVVVELGGAGEGGAETSPVLVRTAGGSRHRLRGVHGLDVAAAEDVARRLAPVRDPGTGTMTGVPDKVSLLDVVGIDVSRPDAIVERWRHPPRGLSACVGRGAAGPVIVDLTNEGDGPHGLVAGSPGSGKSEFLQSLVVSLAVAYSPEQLTFLFVDFKGGLTFTELVRLPHCVGLVRNLDGREALRVKESLQAEMRRRQVALAGGSGDIAVQRGQEMPALVVVIDEYAELADKLPEFLNGVVEVAQIGRALGLHLVLATQTPGTSVASNIQNCVKYRVGFRLQSGAESTGVLGVPAAALLPNRPGRGLLLDGARHLVEFQSAFAHGYTELDDAAPVRVRASTSAPNHGQVAEPRCDLDRVVDAVAAAFELSDLPPPRRPWRDPLPRVVPADIEAGVPAAVSTMPRGHTFSLGLLDRPAEQSQDAYVWDMAQTSNLLVIGEDGAGKSSLLRTVAMVAAASLSPAELRLVAVDLAGGDLGVLADLPHTVAVVSGRTDRLRRLLVFMQRLVTERRRLCGQAGSWRAWHAAQGTDGDDVIVLVDGLDQLLAELEALDAGSWLPGMTQLIGDGPKMGIHFVLATAQPQRVPMGIANAAPERLVLRLSNREASAAAGAVDTSGFGDGRAWSTRWHAEVQLAVTGGADRWDALAQGAVAGELASALARRGIGPVERLPEPPEVLTWDAVADSDVDSWGGSDRRRRPHRVAADR